MVMIRCQQVSRAPLVLLFLFCSLKLNPTSCIPVTKHKEGNQHEPSDPEQTIHFIQSGDVLPETQNEEEDELFKDVDPKTLAALLLEALNKPHETEKPHKNGQDPDKVEEDRDTQNFDREKNEDQELEMLRAAAEAQGREEREREQDEERKREEEEEELLTEKVTSHTTSQIVPVNKQERLVNEVVSKEEQKETEGDTDGNKEEQLSPEELKNLETVLKGFQSYSTATKREHDSGQRESRGDYFDYLDRNGLMNNEIKPKPKGIGLSMSKKKLKLQQEEENRNRPLNKGGNFMDDFHDNTEDQDEENTEEEEEMLSPEEEETRAKAEQEEVRRQAAEAQRAKAEEEKLADIASDMILQYMVKQDGKKHRESNAAEDKRSEEDEDNDDDIDPQTIDKLIEISSKLHLPADDVVDIISDVEKKKKKDASETLQWQRPLVSPPAPAVPSSVLKTSLPSKPPKPNTDTLKSWFKDRAPIRPSQQDFWIKQQWPFWTYPSYPRYQKPYRSYYTIYMPPPQPKPRYYAKPPYSINDILGNSMDYDYPLKPRYRPWPQSRLRAPLAYRRNLYFPNYIVPQPQSFKAIPMPKPRSPVHRFFYSSTASAPQDGYYSQMEQPQPESNEELGNFIEKVLLKRPRMFN